MNRIRRLHPQEMQKIAEAQRQPQPSGQLDRSVWPSVTVAILAYNRWPLTQRCLESVLANLEYPFQLLIIDNGSQPEAVDQLRAFEAAQPAARVIYLKPNIGTAAARNRAVAETHTDYAFLLDNDLICQPGWLRHTLDCAVRRQADFVAPTRLTIEGQVWAAGLEMIYTDNRATLELARWFHDLPLTVVQALLQGRDLPTNFISGGPALMAVKAYHACGGYDESFHSGFEDMDFSLRLIERGYGVWATVNAALRHDDDWQPHSPADVDYARQRYDLNRLRVDADRFKQRWGVEVLPTKYQVRLEERLHRKLGG